MFIAHDRFKRISHVKEIYTHTVASLVFLVCCCEQLYRIEKDIREQFEGDDDYYKKRLQLRHEKSALIIEEFIKYVDIFTKK